MTGSNLTPSDTQHMLRLGQEFGRALVLRAQMAVLREAAEFYILAANAKEEASLRLWWMEGVRNYAIDQFELDEWERKFHLAIWKMSQEEGE